MDRSFWQGRWERGEIGWHQSEVEPLLVQHFPGAPGCGVFVPLCGKSLDADWLARKGHAVVGVELSPIACRAFFEERGTKPEVSRDGAFERWSAGVGEGSVTIWRGDFFELEPRHLGGATAWYDRAATIALPPELRERYASRLQELMLASAGKGGARGLLVTLDYLQERAPGPPFSVAEDEIRRQYGRRFTVERLARESVPFGEGSPLHGVDVRENAFRLVSS